MRKGNVHTTHHFGAGRFYEIIIYAIGEIFYRYENEINWDNVAALADRKEHGAAAIHGRLVIHPKEISQIQYDYIVVFSNRYYEEIKMELSGNILFPLIEYCHTDQL